MRSLPEFFKKLYRPVGIALAGILAVSVAYQGVSNHTLTAEAKQDTLPGIERLRNQFIDTDKTYRILEIQPNVSAAEVGFYIGGQEPFSRLLSDDNKWVRWQDKLATLRTKEERLAFMEAMAEEADDVLSLIGGSGQAPFSYTSYEEAAEDLTQAEAISQGYQSFVIDPTVVRGYFKTATNDNANWQVVFEPLNNWNITLDEINNGLDTPYYKAVFDVSAPFTLGAVKDMAEGDGALTYLYQYDGSYLHFAGTAREVWEYLRESYTVSGGNASSVTDGNASSTVTDGNATVSSGDLDSPTDYYAATFELINGVAGNAVAAGDAVYVANTRDVMYVKSGGNYELVNTAVGIAPGGLYDVDGEIVYYKGGITNAEILRESIFGLDQEEWSRFKIQVDTMTPGMVNTLTKETIQQYDMVYFGNSALKNALLALAASETNTPLQSYTYAQESSQDFTPDALEYLAAYIVKAQIPCIVDSSLVLKIETNNYSFNINWSSKVPNYQKLAILLLHPEKANAFTNDELNQLKPEYKSDMYPYQLESNFSFKAEQIKKLDNPKEQSPVYDGKYVLKNIWAYNSSNSNFFVKRAFDETKFSEAQLAAGFQVVLEEIQAENKIRKADVSTKDRLLSEDITESAVWRYVINYKNRREEVKKSTLRVLQVQPASNQEDSNFKNKLSSASGIATDHITVDCMTIAEFIGVIDDFNAEYDLIYFGDSLKGLNTTGDSTKTADYHDSDMDGLLYCHVGDEIEERTNLSGLLATDVQINEEGEKIGIKSSTMHRYSGNDITVEKYNALMDFIDASYPVVVADSLMTGSTSGETITYDVNDARVDNSSYLYEFLKNSKDKDNFFRKAEVLSTNHEFTFYLNRPKLSMHGFTMLNTEDYREGSEVRVIRKNAADGKYYLSYQFTVMNQGAASVDTDYTCRLYLDSNADGKFSTKNEELGGLTITDSEGRRVETNQLKVEETYTVTRQVPENFEGCITWKLVVQQRDNPYIRTNETGYVRLKKENGEAATRIRILQVYFHSTKSSNIILQEQIGSVTQNEGVYSYAPGTGNTNSNFYKFARGNAGISSEYILDITSISRSDFNTIAAGGSVSDPYDSNRVITSDLSEFNMLIVGFSDAYDGGLDNDWSTEAVELVKRFANDGKSVLLAHDTTSVVNIPKEWLVQDGSDVKYIDEEGNRQDYADWYWGYDMNKLIRDLLGMDTYGVTVSSELQKGEYLSAGNEWYDANNIKIKPDGRYPYNFKDLAYAPNTARASTVPEVQGYIYPVLQSRCNNSDSYLSYRSGHTTINGGYTKTTKKVTKVNEGQITNYPFKIEGNELSVATTHNQYYTLDMNSDSDEDGQTDLVVWYCLSGDIYGASKNDVRNNYYIFNKGNITYTGMGHNLSVAEEEAKLFLNTMIASYLAGTKSPEVNVLNSGSSDDYICGFYDSELTENTLIEIPFSLQDMNMTSGEKQIEVEYWIEDHTATGTTDVISTLPLREITGTEGVVTYDADGNVVTNLQQLKNGAQYKVVVPSAYFEPGKNGNGNEVTLVIRSRTQIIRDGVPKPTAYGIGQVHYLNCELLELD